jgi:hypothetical protein
MALVTADEDAARSIARELHDDITQRLALVSVELGRTVAAEEATAEKVREAACSCQARILEISEGIRRIAHRMHPAILDDFGLSAALEGLCFDLQDVGFFAGALSGSGGSSGDRSGDSIVPVSSVPGESSEHCEACECGGGQRGPARGGRGTGADNH